MAAAEGGEDAGAGEDGHDWCGCDSHGRARGLVEGDAGENNGNGTEDRRAGSQG